MSDYTEYDDDTFDNGGPADLRKAYEKAKREAREAQKALEAEKAARIAAEKKVRSTTLTEILRDKKVNTKVARFLEKDGVEATPEAVDEWLKENGEFFNVRPAADAQQETTDEVVEDVPEDAIPDELANGIQLSQRLDSAGVSPSEVDTIQRINSIPADPNKVQSYEDLVAQLAEIGAPLT